MNIYAKEGSKVIYTGEHGYDSDKKHADKHLEVGVVYTVDTTEVHSWSSRVYLQEVPNHSFNTVHFKDFE